MRPEKVLPEKLRLWRLTATGGLRRQEDRKNMVGLHGNDMLSFLGEK